MRRLLGILAVLGLAACGAETDTNAEACSEADAVVDQIADYRDLDELTDEQAETARQWEFRLAEAAVVATDHDLSADIRDLADATGNVAQDFDDDTAISNLERIHDSVTARCD